MNSQKKFLLPFSDRRNLYVGPEAIQELFHKHKRTSCLPGFHLTFKGDTVEILACIAQIVAA